MRTTVVAIFASLSIGCVPAPSASGFWTGKVQTQGPVINHVGTVATYAFNLDLADVRGTITGHADLVGNANDSLDVNGSRSDLDINLILTSPPGTGADVIDFSGQLDGVGMGGVLTGTVFEGDAIRFDHP